MRALCGAIITAGALIGLGLASLGVGTRYAAYHYFDQDKHEFQDLWVRFFRMDTALVIIVLVLLICVGVGLATAFIGLMFHHERRQREHQLALHQHEREMQAARPLPPVSFAHCAWAAPRTPDGNSPAHQASLPTRR
jgi:hypothetical protein